MALIQSQDGMPSTHPRTATETGLEPVWRGFRVRMGCRQPAPY